MCPAHITPHRPSHSSQARYLACLPTPGTQEPKLVSGAKISDATQVMQSTITPASAPTSNINEKHFGPEPKTVEQARTACLYPPRHENATRDPLTPLDLA